MNTNDDKFNGCKCEHTASVFLFAHNYVHILLQLHNSCWPNRSCGTKCETAARERELATA